MEVKDICPIPLGVEICPFHEEVKQLVLDEISNHGSNYEHRKPKSDTLEHLDYYSPIHAEKYNKFRHWVELQAEIYANDILKYQTGEMIVTDSWINICKPGGYQPPHYHINSVICALYYANFDDDLDTPTYFYQPNPAQQFPDDLRFMLTRRERTKYNSPNEVVGLEGSLLLWPSNLTHGYTTNYSQNRVTISTNIMPTRIGSYRVSSLTSEERNTQMLVQRSGQLWDSPDFI